MKLSSLRLPALALALGLTLAACGGGKAEFDVKGTIFGLAYPGLVLTNNGANDLAVADKASSFAFPGTIEYGTPYSVAIKKQPDHQTCGFGANNVPGSETETAGRQASINVLVTCVLNTAAIGGTVSGLTADGLQLNNGSDELKAVVKDATSYTFTNPLAFGTSYGISILAQPAGLTCRLENPVGTMGDAAITNINIICVPKPA